MNTVGQRESRTQERVITFFREALRHTGAHHGAVLGELLCLVSGHEFQLWLDTDRDGNTDAGELGRI